MKVKELKGVLAFFVGNGVKGICLAPFGIYIKKKSMKDIKTIQHESIHWKQQWEMMLIFFYLWYFVEYLIRLFFFENGRLNNAYRNISFEREAYDNDGDDTYLASRNLFSWTKYLGKK